MSHLNFKGKVGCHMHPKEEEKGQLRKSSGSTISPLQLTLK